VGRALEVTTALLSFSFLAVRVELDESQVGEPGGAGGEGAIGAEARANVDFKEVVRVEKT
jgi:hypothetical protein